MISKNMAMIAVLALAGLMVGQEKADEERFARLIEQLGSASTRNLAEQELARLGVGAATSLARLASEETAAGESARRLLLRLGPDAVPALPVLMEALRRDPVNLSADAVVLTGRIGSYGNLGTREQLIRQLGGWLRLRSAERSLSDASLTTCALAVAWLRLADTGRGLHPLPPDPPNLQSRDPVLRLLAIDILSQDGGPDAIPELALAIQTTHPTEFRLVFPGTKVLDREVGGSSYRLNIDFDRTIRLAAAQAILKISPDHALADIAHAYAIAHGEPDQRTGSLIAMSAMSSVSADAIAVLVEALDGQSEGQRETITALGMIGPAAKDAIPALEKLEEHDVQQIAERARAALRQIKRDREDHRHHQRPVSTANERKSVIVDLDRSASPYTLRRCPARRSKSYPITYDRGATSVPGVRSAS